MSELFGLTKNDRNRLQYISDHFPRRQSSGVGANRHRANYAEAEPGDYDGMFRVVLTNQDGNWTLSVTGPWEGVSGYGYINGLAVAWGTFENATPYEGFLCLVAKIDKTTAFTFRNGIPDMPNAEKGKEEEAEAFYPIAKIDKTTDDDGKEIYSVIQLSRYEFPQLWIGGECDSSEGEQ